jgi:UDP-glucose 4-epimerase
VEISGLRIAVTGAAGFIGSHLADRLALRNELVLIDDFSVGRRENLAALSAHPRVRIARADVGDRSLLEELFAGVDLVFHLAISCLRTSLGNPELSHDVNAGGSLAVCLAARRCGVRRLVYVSSSEVYGSAETAPMSEAHPLRPTTVYGASKLAGELYALAHWRTWRFPVCVVRPFNTYGPREPYSGARAEVIPRFALRLLAGSAPVIYGDGSQTRDFTYVDDTVDGIVRAAACDALVGDVVNVARGGEVSIAEIAAELARLVGRSDLAPEREAARPGDVQRHCADIAKARSLLGFEPRVDLASGLARTLEWLRAEGRPAREQTAAAGAPNW